MTKRQKVYLEIVTVSLLVTGSLYLFNLPKIVLWVVGAAAIINALFFEFFKSKE
ncbi:hypothetical protein [Alkalibacillus haloalkaliphilus]|uniref:hypothetical protein n=1 Tax=Alkalibacillus haloalkaliphilus TaxID=94136 RepID=UPI002935DAF8|nr:hypothetical protein [Alkalibacillus haloalkaliphilus]MDV2582785.1 hypothetical protein [Alkalibacillus haloalkaliphilus]